MLADGRRAGSAAASEAGFVGAEPAGVTGGPRSGPDPSLADLPACARQDFVDFDEDLKIEDLINGIADGFDNVELLKRYSTVGMGPSQGKHSAVAAVRIVAGRPAPISPA